MVANVSDAPGTSASGRATDDTAAGTDGFLQELLGIVGMMPATTPPPAPAAGGAPATAVGDALSANAKTTVDALQAIPAWLNAAVDEAAASTANSESATPNIMVAAAGVAALPTADGLNTQPTQSAADAATAFDFPRAVAETQIATNEVADQTTVSATAVAEKSVASSIEISRGGEEAQVPASKEPAQKASAVTSKDTEASTSSATTNAADAAAKTSSAASAIDIDNLLASMGRLDKEHPRASNRGAGNAGPGVAATGAKSETAAAGESATVLDISATLHAKLEKLEENVGQNKADTASAAPKDGNAAATQFSTLVSNQMETHDTQETSSRHLNARLGTPEWKDQLGAQLNWMVDNGKHSASLKLTPDHLGPVEVRIDVNQNQTSVWFSASNADTRSALEQALPRLRELMASNGMSLNDAGVFREPPREQRGSSNGSQNDSRGIASGGFGSGDAGEQVVAAVRRRSTLLDTYA